MRLMEKSVLFLHVLLGVFLLPPCLLPGGEHGFSEPIDIVYLWVDGSDHEWQNVRNYYLSSEHIAKTKPDATAQNRFSDHEELKYSLRSIWKFAPFFHHIYIVTMGQQPRWLKPSPHITIVDHKEIFTDADCLPTFNSMAIECHLHRIPNLSEHFIYFNDDMFLGRLVSPLDFFTKDGKIRVLLESSACLPSGSPRESDNSFLLACRNTNILLDEHYGSARRKLIYHAPYALMKSYMEQAEMEFYEAFDSTSLHKFRSPSDYTITNGLVQYYCLYNNKATAGNLKTMTITLYDDKDVKMTKRAFEDIREFQPHTICFQDKMSDNNKHIEDLLYRFLDQYFPDAAPWEQVRP